MDGDTPRSPQSPTPQNKRDNPLRDLWKPAPLPIKDLTTTANQNGTNAGDASTTPPPNANTTVEEPARANPRKISLQALISMGGVRPKNDTNAKLPKHDPLSKYLKADMPEIHDAHASALFDLVDSDLITEWDRFPEWKLAIIPFGIDIQSHEQLRNIKDHIFTAVTEITQSQSLGISAPEPNEKAKTIGRHPTTFLVYGLSEKQCQTLEQRHVWASPELTFRVASTDPCRPNFLFTIGEFTTNDKKHVEQMVTRIWNDEESQEFFNSLTQAMETDDQSEDSPLTQEEVRAFVNSMWITVIKLLVYIPAPTDKDPNATIATLKPRFNILADHKHIRDIQVWSQIRHFLAKRSYHTAVLGQGTTYIAPHNCGICHSVDHPRGLCPFPSLPGWNGPKNRTKEYRSRPDFDHKSRAPKPKRQRT